MSEATSARRLAQVQKHRRRAPPAVRRAIDAGVFDALDEPPDADYRFGLQSILDGLESRMASRSRQLRRLAPSSSAGQGGP